MTGIEYPPLPERRQPHQRGSLTTSDWEKYREIISQMYSAHPLKEVVSKMASEHGFVATERMYKTRISQWHLNKNMKSHEMAALVRDVQQGTSAGNDAAPLQLGGKIVPRSKLERFARRHKKDFGRGQSPSVTTPEDLNEPSPSISHGYTMLSIVEHDVEVSRPPPTQESESVDNTSYPSSTFNPPLPQPVLNEPFVTSPGPNASSAGQITTVAPLPGALVSKHPSCQNPAAESSSTSMLHTREQGDKLCRCKIHTDACDRSQFGFRAEKCIDCQRYFCWTTHALFYITTMGGDFLCRCKWHDRACRALQEDYDARKCVCCKGWFAFSEQANNLIKAYASDAAYWSGGGPSPVVL